MSRFIEFKLFAPRNQTVELLGSFHNWQPITMRKGKDGYFRISVDLEDGVYEYRFKLQSVSWHLPNKAWVEINDPYITEIDPFTQSGVVRIQNGQRINDSYKWQYDSKPLPANQNLVIYELHVADFNGKDGKPPAKGEPNVYQQVIAKLDYLCELGINAIELMPINEYPGNYSWGYLISYFFASECSYGPPTSLKQLIDECHKRGIRVIIDGIYNHSDEQCPLVQIDRDYWYYHGPRRPEDPDNYWGPEFNYEFYDEQLGIYPAREFIRDVVKFWIQEYHIDGIRYDAIAQIENDEFLNWLIQETKQFIGDREFYNIAECIPETPDILTPKGPLDGCWHESFRIFTLEHINGKKFDLNEMKQVLKPQEQGYAEAASVVNYLASHDRNHLMAELGSSGIFDDEAFSRAKLGAVLLMTAVGVPMLAMGEEFGACSKQTPNKPNPINWSLLDNERNRHLFDTYQRLIELRGNHPALQSNRIDFYHEDHENKILAYIRESEDEQDKVLVITNFGDRELPDYAIANLPHNTEWQDYLNQEPISVNSQPCKFNLEPLSAKVLVLQNSSG